MLGCVSTCPGLVPDPASDLSNLERDYVVWGKKKNRKWNNVNDIHSWKIHIHSDDGNQKRTSLQVLFLLQKYSVFIRFLIKLAEPSTS